MDGWEALRVDFVYTEGHLKLMGLDPKRPPEWVVVAERPISLLTGQEVTFKKFFFPQGLDLEKAAPFVLRHLAGVARMRMVLGVPPDPKRWMVDLDPVHQESAPDALWLNGGERIAIEYDAGYPKPIVLEKFYGLARRHDRQIWGAPTWTRAGYLGKLVPEGLRPKVRVLRAPWF